MRKTLILAAATLAIGLAGQARAGWNNGPLLNGIDTQNGIDHSNGVSTNGLDGMNGVRHNGTVAAPRADVTLQGVTLSDGEVIHSIVMPD